MHVLVYAIVYARNKEEALEKAKAIFAGLYEKRLIAYFATFDMTDFSPQERWGYDIPAVMNALRPDAMKRINEAMDKTWEFFKENITVVRKLLDTYTDEEIFEEEAKEEKIGNGGFDPIRIARRYFDYIARSEGLGIYLYDGNGIGITSRHQLKEVMNKWEKMYEDLDIWLVPAELGF